MVDISPAPEDEWWVDFRGVTLPAALADDGKVYVAVRPVIEAIGISWPAQTRRIRRDPVLSEQVTSVALRATQEAQRRTVLALPLEFLHGFLFGVSAANVPDDDIRERLVIYQRECYGVLFDAFRRRAEARLPAAPDAVQLARDIRETRIGVDGILDVLWRRIQHDDASRKLLERVQLDVHEVGGLLEDGDALTERQRRTLYQFGLEVALLLTQSGEPQNPYALVFGGLKKRFGIGKREKYHAIPRNQYHEAYEYLAKRKADLQHKIREQGDEPHIS